MITFLTLQIKEYVLVRARSAKMSGTPAERVSSSRRHVQKFQSMDLTMLMFWQPNVYSTAAGVNPSKPAWPRGRYKSEY